MKTLQTFTLREIAFLEGESYQNILNANKRGEFVAVAVRSGLGKNTKTSLRYLSRSMSKILISIMSENLLDPILEEDLEFYSRALERKKTQKLSSHSKQYGIL